MFKLIKAKLDNFSDRLKERRIQKMKELSDLCREVSSLIDKKLDR